MSMLPQGIDPPIRPSTKWEWKRVKVSQRPEGLPAQRSRSEHLPAFPAHDRRKSLAITVVYLGGPESKWLVIRGNTKRTFPGWIALEDLLVILCGEGR